MGWQEKTEIFWDEKMVGVLSAWGKGEERRLRSRSEPDLEGLQASKEHGLFLEGSKRTPSRFSAGTGFTFKESCGSGVKGWP